MRLEKIIIENYRGYHGRIEVSLNDLTAFIGKNDVGKTTILDALGVFF
ncbi:AAA family ATPase [Aeromonas veronii]